MGDGRTIGGNVVDVDKSVLFSIPRLFFPIINFLTLDVSDCARVRGLACGCVCVSVCVSVCVGVKLE